MVQDLDTYQDVGGLAAEMGIGFKASLPILGTVSGQYVPKADGSENGDKVASGTMEQLQSKVQVTEIVVKTCFR